MTSGMTVKEAADTLDNSLMTVYIKIRKGEIKVRRHGRYMCILREGNERLFRDREALAA